MLRYKTETRPGLVALYDIRPGNAAGPFLYPGARTGRCVHKLRRFDPICNAVKSSLEGDAELLIYQTFKRVFLLFNIKLLHIYFNLT